MRKIKLFTHTDLDGIGCAIVAKVFAQTVGDVELDITYCQNDEISNAVSLFLTSTARNYDSCYITDLSVSEAVADQISNCSLDIHLLDHHVSALWLNAYSWAVVMVSDPETHKPCCGTSVFYDTLFSDINNPLLAEFVENVRLWDTWEWKDTDAAMPRLYNIMLGNKGRDEFIEELMPLLIHEPAIPKGWREIACREELKKQEYIERMKQFAFDYAIDGYMFRAIFASQYISELGNTLAAEDPDNYYGAAIIYDGVVSLRAVREDADVSAIATKFGGGGHRLAAGFSLTPNHKKRMMGAIFNQGEACAKASDNAVYSECSSDAEQAIQILAGLKDVYQRDEDKYPGHKKYVEALESALNALNKTVPIFANAVDKKAEYQCPHCGRILVSRDDFDDLLPSHCEGCGQRVMYEFKSCDN